MLNAVEFRELYPLFLAILQPDFDHPLPVPESVEKMIEETDPAAVSQVVPEEAVAWLDLLDRGISPERLRRHGEEKKIPADAARALFRYWAARKLRSAEDRDKVDWLATRFSRVREEEKKQPTGWVKIELQTLLKGIAFSPLGSEAQSFLGDLPPLLDDARHLGDFSQIADSCLLERGRELKAQLGEEFCHPAALAAVVNYNLIVGRRFDELLERKLKETSTAPSGAAAQELAESLHKDYRHNGPALRQLADLVRKQPTKETTVQAAPSLEPVLNPLFRRLDIDGEHELSKLRGRIRDLATKLMAEPAVRSLRICGSPLSLSDWETHALCSLSTRREETLQGAFVRSVARAVALVVRIYEELHAYETKKGAGNPGWKKHHDSLFYLLCEGRGHRAFLQQLALLHRKSGLPELAQQLTLTADKLRANLGRLDELF